MAIRLVDLLADIYRNLHYPAQPGGEMNMSGIRLTPKQEFEEIIRMRNELYSRRISELVNVYGSLRLLGNALNIDHAYLHRLQKGQKQNPSKSVLRKLGLL